MDKVSVIIPTYNRFDYLMKTIKSIQTQTYNNIEIIVVNDCSTQKEYYEFDWTTIKNLKILHLKENTKNILGYACAGFVRNQGIQISEGKYIAFCDDDDIWFPLKIELQLKEMERTDCKISSTDGLIGCGVYDPIKKYNTYNGKYAYNYIKYIYKEKGSILMDNGFPKIWNLDFLEINNSVICSSVLIEKEILEKINYFKNIKNGEEDYDCWLRALQHTNLVYLDDVLFYYDLLHGNGQNY